MGARLSRVLFFLFAVVATVSSAGCSASGNQTAAKVKTSQVSADGLTWPLPERTTVVEVNQPVEGIVGIAFGTAVVENAEGQKIVIPVYLADHFKPGDVVWVYPVYVPNNMYRKAQGLIR